MYNSIDEAAGARSLRELRAEAAQLTAERAALGERVCAAEARVAALREETVCLAKDVCVVLKTVRKELTRKDAQRAELVARASAPPPAPRSSSTRAHRPSASGARAGPPRAQPASHARADSRPGGDPVAQFAQIRPGLPLPPPPPPGWTPR
ncbi:hypothetical protein T492DRAFT_1035590 [Pavlovales sp. CCMP2436]|nr:hypothetical protein T492DRAFT_1035590 [Pavlovales sp. CCMP2436]